MFPADAVIGDESTFVAVIRRAIELAAAGQNMVVLGVTPNRPETGYGYIETGDILPAGEMRVRRFTEKPNAEKAEEFVAAGNYHWNSGIFVWSARTLANAVREHLPETAHGTPEFDTLFSRLYPQCENISVDYAILEPRSAKGEHHSNLFCLPANFGWNDLGSWAALYEHQLDTIQTGDEHANVFEAAGATAINARGNYVFSPHKHVAVVGVENIVVVETDDAILVTTLNHSQEVGKVVKELVAKGRTELV